MNNPRDDAWHFQFDYTPVDDDNFKPSLRELVLKEDKLIKEAAELDKELKATSATLVKVQDELNSKLKYLESQLFKNKLEREQISSILLEFERSR